LIRNKIKTDITLTHTHTHTHTHTKLFAYRSSIWKSSGIQGRDKLKDSHDASTRH